MEASEYPVSNIPEPLKELDQWVGWRRINKEDRTIKMPVNIHTGAAASSSDPRTWSSFEDALAYFAKHRELAGLGFVFTDSDPYAGVDLDDCLDTNGDFIWGRDVVKGLQSYTEISPSGHGVKLFVEASKPERAKCRKDGFGPLKIGKVEVYDRGRFFAVTGERMKPFPLTIENREDDLNAMCNWLWPQQASQSKTTQDGTGSGSDTEAAYDACLSKMRAMKVTDHNDGSHRLYAACCRCVEFNLGDQSAIRCIRQYASEVPFPKQWTDDEITKRLRDAESKCDRRSTTKDASGTNASSSKTHVEPKYLPVDKLVASYPEMRQPIIEGLLRQGETMNVIAPPKLGKSWLVTDLAVAIATGRRWLDVYDTHQGNVLLLDNELHAETSASRIPRVTSARGLQVQDIGQSLCIDNLRGRLPDLKALSSYFLELPKDHFKIIILDAFYRFLPKDTDENSNANITDLYNLIDGYSAQLNCSFILVHHASKGNQSGKSVTDVGAGAGSQARASDTHMVLRHHQEAGCVVVDAAVRSWPPIEPQCLRWDFPIWHRDDLLDPKDLKLDYPRRKSEGKTTTKKEAKEQWTAERFVEMFVCEEPQRMTTIRSRAGEAMGSMRKAKYLQQEAVDLNLIHVWKAGANQPLRLATIEQPKSSELDDF